MKFNDNGGFVVGTYKHLSCIYKKSLFFVVYKRSLLVGSIATTFLRLKDEEIADMIEGSII